MTSWTIGTRAASQQCPRVVIPQDPGFEILPSNPITQQGSMSSRVDYMPVGRVRPEAREIANRHHLGSVGILFQSAEPREYAHRKPAKKDYIKQNFRRLREIERHAQSRLEPAIEKQQPVIKSALKYRETPSRLGTASRPPTAANRPLTPSQKNFIAFNNKQAADYHMKRPPSAEKIRETEEKLDRNLKAYRRGSIPSYLKKRQEEWHQHEIERILKIPDPHCPPGHIAMAETERVETLNLLSENKCELLDELKCMPMRTDSLKCNLKKAMIENKLAEIDDAIKIFSRKKVFVKQD